MNDPYCWPGSSCLRNKPGIRDVERLAVFETRIVSVRDAQAAREPIPGEYNLEHLGMFHRFLFGDIYDWAGETRVVDISKPGATFCHWRYVDDEVASVLAALPADDLLLGLKEERFIERLAHYYGELNARHPFREGNGRAHRAFLRQLAAAAGWRLDWSELVPEENVRACQINVQTADVKPLVHLLRPAVSKL